MQTTHLLLLTLGLLGGVACARQEAPRELGTQTPTTPSEPKPTPQRPYTGYEGYTLLYDAGLVQVLTAQPDAVGGTPHLYLLDREGKVAGEVLADHLRDYEGRGSFCDGSLTEAGPYLALLAKYDFTDERKHQSRLLLLDKRSLKLVSNRLFAQPGLGGDQWVRQSFTLADGSTYLSFDKRSYYLLSKEGMEMTKLSMPLAYAKGAYAWGDKGYFFLDKDEAVYQFSSGQVKPTRLPLFAGTSVHRVYPAGGAWLVLRDQQARYQLFSMATGKVVARFHLGEPAGRTMVYDEPTKRIFYGGDKNGRTGADAKERSVFVSHLTEQAFQTAGAAPWLPSEPFYRLTGRTESDNTIGMQLQLGLVADRRQLLVSWLDEGRGGPHLHPVSKAVSLSLDASPAVSLSSYTFHQASDIRLIFPLARVE